MSLRRGIEPIIATVILVAVALIIAVAVVGYLMGLFGGLAGGSPQISITNIILREDGKLEFYINNAGAGSDRLLKIEVISGSQIIDSSAGAGAAAVMTISGNFKGWITTISLSNINNKVNVGDTVIVKFYFEKSGTHTINVVISPKAS